MSDKLFCCQGCGKLYIGSHPAQCECGSADIKQGIEKLSYTAKQELAAIRRKEANASVTKQYRLRK
jgi:hypothetical protein